MPSIRINNNWNYQKNANYRSTLSLKLSLEQLYKQVTSVRSFTFR